MDAISFPPAPTNEPNLTYAPGSAEREALLAELAVQEKTQHSYRAVIGGKRRNGGGAEMKNIDVVRTICALLQQSAPPTSAMKYEDLITYVTDRPGHDSRYAIDASKIERQLGFKPAETFETGLAKTVAWYLENRSWWQRVLDGSYQLVRIGTSAAS